jgi:hypothetical protein
MDFKIISVWACEKNSSGSRQGLVTGSYAPPGPKKGGEFLDQMTDYQLLKK